MCIRDRDLNMRTFRPNKTIIATIYKVGVPSIIMQSIGSVMVFGMNKILLIFSSTAAAVFGVYFKLQSFISVSYTHLPRVAEAVSKAVKELI